MAHHKRGRPKSSRAGCLMCKSHKRNGCYQLQPFEVRAKDRMDASEAFFFGDDEFGSAWDDGEYWDDDWYDHPNDRPGALPDAPKVTLQDVWKRR